MARAQLGQSGGRELGVSRGQGIGEDTRPRGQGRGHQGPVGVALGPGQGEGGLDFVLLNNLPNQDYNSLN